MPASRRALAEIFRAAGKAHHRAFAATNGDDPAWAEWYAQDLAPTLSDFLGTTFVPGELAAALRALDADMRARAPLAEWPLYYADWFLARQPSIAGRP
jgi:CO/xanthine dehydrogenase FAD-binding subunit